MRSGTKGKYVGVKLRDGAGCIPNCYLDHLLVFEVHPFACLESENVHCLKRETVLHSWYF